MYVYRKRKSKYNFPPYSSYCSLFKRSPLPVCRLHTLWFMHSYSYSRASVLKVRKFTYQDLYGACIILQYSWNCWWIELWNIKTHFCAINWSKNRDINNKMHLNISSSRHINLEKTNIRNLHCTSWHIFCKRNSWKGKK